MRIALLCDVDQTVYHVGDEAIATATTRRLLERGHEVRRISRHEKYGPGGAASAEGTIPALTFPWPLEDRARYLAEIRAVLAGERDALPAGDKLFAIIEELRGVDALVIGGGGSLTSRFGWLLDERLATALVARALGTPVVLSGQSLGPELTPADREAVAELLGLCRVVGLRDAASTELARRLAPGHPAIVHTLDDALGLREVTDAEPVSHTGEQPVISVTVGADGEPLPREDYLRLLAAVVTELAGRTGARVELVPHMADPDEGGSDEQAHAELAALLDLPVIAHRIETDTVSAARTVAADWVVTTRFHPAVFGTLAGAGVLALPLNRYGILRMDGALAATGLGGGTVPLAALWVPAAGTVDHDLLGAVLTALIQGREQERAQLAAARPRLREAAEFWWDTVSAELERARTEPASAPAGADPHGAGIPLRPRFGSGLRERLAPWLPPAARGPEAGEPPAPAAAIVMRTRDRLRLLDRAVQDVLAQTRQDWELVVVDDGGDAAAVDAVLERHLPEAGERLRVLHRETSHGMEAASNLALRATTAPAIAIHDDDDTWHGTFLQETLAHLAAHPEQEAVVVRTLIVHEHEVATGYVEDAAFPSWPELGGVRLLDYVAVNRHVPIAMLYRRRAHEATGPFQEDLPVVGDYAFHLALLQRFEVGFLERPLAQWRQRPAAVGAQANSMNAAAEGHRHYDAVLRERAFKAWTTEHGLGLPMYLTKTTETQLAGTEERLLAEIRDLTREVRDLRGQLAETREELGAVHHRVRRLDPFALGGRAWRRLRPGDRAAQA